MTHHYSPLCKHCLPVVVDPVTGKPYPADHLVTRHVLAAWAEQPYEVREAFIEVTVNNAREPQKIKLAEAFVMEVSKLLLAYSEGKLPLQCH